MQMNSSDTLSTRNIYAVDGTCVQLHYADECVNSEYSGDRLIPIDFLSEEAINDALTKIHNLPKQLYDTYKFGDFDKLVDQIVRQRHFSENFILKWFDHLTPSAILVHHKDDIISGRYASLNLKYEMM